MTTPVKNRPLSPHLQVYKPQMTSMLSILHRMTGIANTIGLLFVAWWLVAATTGSEQYADFIDFITSPLGTFMLFGWTFSVIYHMCNGIRHLIWDTGKLLKIKDATKAGYTVVIVALILTTLIWLT
tara:strand:+ start:328 stop:705 length:378 start_codon:yes stop_codon:yes gene_type:complete